MDEKITLAENRRDPEWRRRTGFDNVDPCPVVPPLAEPRVRQGQNGRWLRWRRRTYALPPLCPRTP